jgi:16S rRNA (adenine(1408)-N(1))-methyltransferase
VLRRAAAEPDAFVLGLDANAAGMADASRRTPPVGRRGSTPNAAFVVAAAEAVPGELVGRASLLTVNFPWGSLLRGILGCDDAALAGLASLLMPDGRIEVLTSLGARDAGSLGVSPDRLADRLAIAAAWLRHGLELISHRPATAPELAACGSSWSKRLRSSANRSVVLAGSRR